jgi:hypothetical protein
VSFGIEQVFSYRTPSAPPWEARAVTCFTGILILGLMLSSVELRVRNNLQGVLTSIQCHWQGVGSAVKAGWLAIVAIAGSSVGN